ncbi:MAG: DUF4037 domain-containing protein [Ruminococcus sp.]|nr:DUF4037 domain-containing protein [Ruminococcus sp.]
MIEALFNDLSETKEVEAIALGGSRAENRYDEKSDYDIYVYITAPIDEEVRKNILKKHCRTIEVGAQFWELEDNCVLNDGVGIDIIYRYLDSFSEEVAEVVEKHKQKNAYTTCMWHNLKTCRIIYDRNGRLEQAKKRFDIPYPAELKANIINNNMKLLHGALPAYDMQIIKAVNRGDRNSVNHRIAGFMETYFDVIFAINEMTHPGEKRLVNICKEECKILPENFEENINSLFRNAFTNPRKLKDDLYKITNALIFII